MHDERRAQDEFQLQAWQYEHLRDWFDIATALELAQAGVSWHDADRLIRAGCDPLVAHRILSPT